MITRKIKQVTIDVNIVYEDEFCHIECGGLMPYGRSYYDYDRKESKRAGNGYCKVYKKKLRYNKDSPNKKFSHYNDMRCADCIKYEVQK
jgi:hypothetical protein